MAGLLSIRGPEVWQKDFLIKRCVWITGFEEERGSLTTGKAGEAAVGVVCCTNVLLVALVSPPRDVAGDSPLAQKCLNTTVLGTLCRH